MSTKPLTSSSLYRSSLLDHPECKSTKYIEPIDEIVGQERAQHAVEFAMSIKEKGYNIYAIGQNGLGKRTMILRYLNRHEPNGHGVYDWCYVANFDDNRVPKVLKLPAGMGTGLKKDIEKMMSKLVKAFPLAFDNEIYFSRADSLKNQMVKKQESGLAALTKEAKESGVSLALTTDGDYQFIAMAGEELHTEETFAELSNKEKEQFETAIDGLEIKLRKMVRALTTHEEKFSEKIKKLNDQTALDVISHFIETLKEKYSEHADVKRYLADMQDDMIENVDIFLQEGEEQLELSYASLEKKMPRRYQINVLVNRCLEQEQQFPIVVEESPNYHTIFGYVENATFKGTVFTDYSLIRAGSLHKANGGVLLMDAAKVLERPHVWDGLKKALRSQSLNMSSLERELTLSGAISLEPEAIPLDVKIILFGDYQTYQLLQHYDAEFSELFRVTADFEDEMERTRDSEYQYARFISSIVESNKMLHCDRKAIARIIEYSSRQAGDQAKLSLHSVDIANLLRESNYAARSAKSNMIRVGHVEHALLHKELRVSRLKDSVMQSFVNGTTLIQTEGKVVGQVNALSVISTSDFQFGAPNRISATTAYGEGEIFDIERKVELGGSIHSKGVFILSAYLASVFAQTAKIPLSTHITFEQNYGGVDGDSATMAELCAIISSYSKIPLRQDVSITGSMNQFGEAQPIGGVNEKIEGFFDVCMIKGRHSKQGVIIPQSNVHNLMLRKDIVEAVKKGTFTIWPISHVKEAIEILTDVDSGFDASESEYSTESVFGQVTLRLSQLSEPKK
jgi:lon-related putative ATP-dependent protease